MAETFSFPLLAPLSLSLASDLDHPFPLSDLSSNFST